MNSISPRTYKDHLNLLAEPRQTDAPAYETYLQEAQILSSQNNLSPTLTFLLDFGTKTYPVLGDNISRVMGHPKEAFLEGGLDFTLYQYKDFDILNQKIFPKEVSIIKDTGSENLSQLRFSKSYRFKNDKGEYKTVLQQNNMICAKNQSVPVAIFGFIWEITHFAEQGKVMHLIEKYDADSASWNTILSKAYYPDIDQNQLLSKREVEILKWSVEGLGAKQLAEKLHISFNTVNTHRRNMLRKTNCQNSLELLKYALENKLL